VVNPTGITELIVVSVCLIRVRNVWAVVFTIWDAVPVIV
jgi:hypothetical protein